MYAKRQSDVFLRPPPHSSKRQNLGQELYDPGYVGYHPVLRKNQIYLLCYAMNSYTTNIIKESMVIRMHNLLLKTVKIGEDVKI